MSSILELHYNDPACGCHYSRRTHILREYLCFYQHITKRLSRTPTILNTILFIIKRLINEKNNQLASNKIRFYDLTLKINKKLFSENTHTNCVSLLSSLSSLFKYSIAPPKENGITLPYDGLTAKLLKAAHLISEEVKISDVLSSLNKQLAKLSNILDSHKISTDKQHKKDSSKHILLLAQKAEIHTRVHKAIKKFNARIHIYSFDDPEEAKDFSKYYPLDLLLLNIDNEVPTDSRYIVKIHKQNPKIPIVLIKSMTTGTEKKINRHYHITHIVEETSLENELSSILSCIL